MRLTGSAKYDLEVVSWVFRCDPDIQQQRYMAYAWIGVRVWDWEYKKAGDSRWERDHIYVDPKLLSLIDFPYLSLGSSSAYDFLGTIEVKFRRRLRSWSFGSEHPCWCVVKLFTCSSVGSEMTIVNRNTSNLTCGSKDYTSRTIAERYRPLFSSIYKVLCLVIEIHPTWWLGR